MPLMNPFVNEPTSITRVDYNNSACGTDHITSKQVYDFDKCYDWYGSTKYTYHSQSEVY